MAEVECRWCRRFFACRYQSDHCCNNCRCSEIAYEEHINQARKNLLNRVYVSPRLLTLPKSKWREIEPEESIPLCTKCRNKVNMDKGLRLGDNEWIHEECYKEMIIQIKGKH